MSKRRKMVEILVKVSAPPHLTTKEVHREVRTLIEHQSNFMHDVDHGDIRVLSLKRHPVRVPPS